MSENPKFEDVSFIDKILYSLKIVPELKSQRSTLRSFCTEACYDYRAHFRRGRRFPLNEIRAIMYSCWKNISLAMRNFYDIIVQLVDPRNATNFPVIASNKQLNDAL